MICNTYKYVLRSPTTSKSYTYDFESDDTMTIITLFPSYYTLSILLITSYLSYY